jgi:hypothetical protein
MEEWIPNIRSSNCAAIVDEKLELQYSGHTWIVQVQTLRTCIPPHMS